MLPLKMRANRVGTQVRFISENSSKLRAKQRNIVVGIGFEFAELTIDFKLYDILEIDGNEFLPNFIIEQNSILNNGHDTHELIIPHLAHEPETNAYINVMLTDINKDAFQFKRSDRSLLLVGHYGEDLRHAVYKR